MDARYLFMGDTPLPLAHDDPYLHVSSPEHIMAIGDAIAMSDETAAMEAEYKYLSFAFEAFWREHDRLMAIRAHVERDGITPGMLVLGCYEDLLPVKLQNTIRNTPPSHMNNPYAPEAIIVMENIFKAMDKAYEFIKGTVKKILNGFSAMRTKLNNIFGGYASRIERLREICTKHQDKDLTDIANVDVEVVSPHDLDKLLAEANSIYSVLAKSYETKLAEFTDEDTQARKATIDKAIADIGNLNIETEHTNVQGAITRAQGFLTKADAALKKMEEIGRHHKLSLGFMNDVQREIDKVAKGNDKEAAAKTKAMQNAVSVYQAGGNLFAQLAGFYKKYCGMLIKSASVLISKGTKPT